MGIADGAQGADSGKGLVSFLVSKKIVRNSNAAVTLLLGVVILCLALSLYILFKTRSQGTATYYEDIPPQVLNTLPPEVIKKIPHRNAY